MGIDAPMTIARVGIVIIGRNEGARLIACLQSLVGSNAPIVYVDSASTDGSQDVARAHNANVVDLDMSKPFNAARARNEGFERLRTIVPTLDYVQFVDGDCEVDDRWIETATSFLDANPHVAVVCGRRREKFPHATPFNALCDREWNTPIGEAAASGGDALMRVDALNEVNGFDSKLVAHEEPELAMRLRAKGWKIWRIDAEMTRHDAAITMWRQVWKRSRRGGFGYAQVFAKDRFSRRSEVFASVARSLFWGVAIPLGGMLMALWSPWALLMIPAIYGVQFLRLFARGDGGLADRSTYAAYILIAKFAEARGNLEWFWKSLTGARMDAILYKVEG